MTIIDEVSYAKKAEVLQSMINQKQTQLSQLQNEVMVLTGRLQMIQEILTLEAGGAGGKMSDSRK